MGRFRKSYLWRRLQQCTALTPANTRNGYIYCIFFDPAFCSQQLANKVYLQLANCDEAVKQLSDDVNPFDLRSFEQACGDYIDLAKLAQLIPFVGQR